MIRPLDQHDFLAKGSLMSRSPGHYLRFPRAWTNPASRIPGLLLAAGILWGLVPTDAQPPLPSPRPARSPSSDSAAARSWKVVGVASCSAAACHNAPLTDTPKRSEYAVWISRDKHAHAYATLFEQRSVRIQANRGVSVPAHEDALCLKCHVSPNYHLEKQNPRFDLADGVHCENCHGPAEGWLAVHSRPAWSQMDLASRTALGFRPMKDLLERTRACMDCHVGSPANGADVNHDLIAAGHPRLYFAMHGYMARYPRHWSAADDRQRYPDYDARLWALGQLLAASQSLKLLAWRATEANKNPWPELAEYDCYSCHQVLLPAPRPKPEDRPHPLGLPPPNSWYVASLAPLLQQHARSHELDNLRSVQQALTALTNPRHSTATAALDLAHSLDRCAQEVAASNTDAASWNAVLDALLRHYSKAAPQTWDEAAQAYLALQAVVHTLSDVHPAGPRLELLRTHLPQVRKHLMFPAGKETPPLDFNPSIITDLAHKALQVESK